MSLETTPRASGDMDVLVVLDRPFWNEFVLRYARRVFLLTTFDDPAPADPDRYAGIYRVTSFDSLEELSAVAGDLVARAVHIDRVVNQSEHTQFTASFLADLLGLGRPDLLTTCRTRDKRAMKHRVSQSGVLVPRFMSVPAGMPLPPPEVVRESLGATPIVKPVAGGGAVGTGFLADAEADPHLDPGARVLEEYIDGEEFHVDAVWRAGTPLLLSVSQYFQPLMTAVTQRWGNGSMHLHPERHRDLYDQVLEMHLRVNQALGITDGATHLEFFRLADGRICFSEVATRPGGLPIPEMVDEVYGIDFRDLWARELLDVDLPTEQLAPVRSDVTGTLQVTPENDGVLATLPSVEELRSHANIVRAGVQGEPGDTFTMNSTASWSYIVIVNAETEQAFHQAIDDIATTFRVTTHAPL